MATARPPRTASVQSDSSRDNDPALGILALERGGTRASITRAGDGVLDLLGAFTYLHEQAVNTRQSARQLWILDETSIDRSPAALARAQAAGWNIRLTIDKTSETDSWLHAYLPGAYTLSGFNVVFPRLDTRAPWGKARDAATLISGLRAYARALGMPFYRSPQVTAAHLLKSLHQGEHATPLETPGTLPAPALRRNARQLQDAPLMWRRSITRDELRTRPYFLRLDVNAQHLRAANGLALGFGEPVHLSEVGAQAMLATGYEQSKRKILPGYYRVRAFDNQRRWLQTLPFPHPLYRSGKGMTERMFGEAGVWVSAPTIHLLIEQGVPVAGLEAWVWPEHHRFLDPWYTRMTRARTTLMQPTSLATPAGALAYGAFKNTYSKFLGGWLASGKKSPDDELFRPPWRHAIIAEARAGVYRAATTPINRGYIPALWTEDTLAFLVETDDPYTMAAALGIRLSDAPGHYKVSECLDLRDDAHAELLDALLGERASVMWLKSHLLAKRRALGLASETDEEDTADEESAEDS